MDVDVLNVAQQLADNAEEFEMNQGKLIAFINENGKDAVKEAVDVVDWKTVVEGYNDSTLRRVEGSMTNIQFTKPQRVRVQGVVMAEITARNKDMVRPTGNGMASDGGQQ